MTAVPNPRTATVREALGGEPLWEALTDLIAEQRDRFPRLADDMDSGELAEAVLTSDALTAVVTDLCDQAAAGALDSNVERGRVCYHGTPGACGSYRCGSNCSQRFDRMHPCPACLIAEIAELRAALADPEGAGR